MFKMSQKLLFWKVLNFIYKSLKNVLEIHIFGENQSISKMFVCGLSRVFI